VSTRPQFRKHTDSLAELLAGIRDGLTDDQLAQRLAALPPMVRRKLGADEEIARELLLQSTREHAPVDPHSYRDRHGRWRRGPS
jgi:hypothetical protein